MSKPHKAPGFTGSIEFATFTDEWGTTQLGGSERHGDGPMIAVGEPANAGAVIADRQSRLARLRADAEKGQAAESGRLRGGKGRAAQRRIQAERDLRAVDTIKRKNPLLSIPAAARTHLSAQEADWYTWTDEERARKTENLVRRISGARRRRKKV